MPTSRNARGVDIIAYSSDMKRIIKIQVKALSKFSPVPLGTSLEKVHGDFWIIITNALENPCSYIMASDEIKKYAHHSKFDRAGENKTSYWLEPKSYNVDLFKEKWDRVGNG